MFLRIEEVGKLLGGKLGDKGCCLHQLDEFECDANLWDCGR